MPTIYIDDQAYEVPEGDNVLAACLSAGLDLPYFCWHPEMGSVGACRQCALVQYRDAEDTRGRIVMGCMTPVSDGARFSMQGGDASEFRENIVESLMLNHPHDCPVCAEGGECHLQDMTVMVGHRNRRYRGKKNTHKNQDLGPLIHHEMNRCITCYRCTRFYNDYAGGKDLSAQAAHDHVYFGRQTDGTLESEFAGNLVEVCPTGVFTDKPLVNDYTRKWDLQSAPSICTGCALGCNTMPGERYGKLKRIHNRFNNEVNGYFLCDRGRYGGNYVNDEQRPQFAGLKQNDGRYNAIEAEDAISKLASWCNDAKVAAIGSPRASLESNFLLQQLVGADSFANGLSNTESALVHQCLDAMRNSGVKTPSLRDIESADAILILGEDVTNTAPRMALSLRQAVRNRAKQLAAEMRIPEWQDEAVRNLAQDELSPLFVVGVCESRLADVATEQVNLAPADIARFGHALAAKLNQSANSDAELDNETEQLANQIAQTLSSAERPLIISGTACLSVELIQAAAAIASALDSSKAMLSYCFNEANTLGAALLSEQKNPNLDSITQRAKNGEIDTLIVLENDLYRRGPSTQIDELINSVDNLVVLDTVESPTLSQASLVLPAASFAESEGTLVSNEGRAQRHYPVYLPSEQTQASWQWFNQVRQHLQQESFNSFDDVTQACANAVEALQKITQASPPAEHRSRGVKIPRQTHRASGRTAMRSNISVHEPKQPVDENSPLAYTMEGDNTKQSGALLPFVWSPGWNSNQSLHKFQSEAGGALAGGTAGARLIDTASQNSYTADTQIPDAFTARKNEWLLVPIYRVFGSDELSAKSPAVDELVDQPFIELSTLDANTLNAKQGDSVNLTLPDGDCEMTLHINDSLPAGCAGYSVGLPGARWLAADTSVAIRRADTEGN